jgi:DNA-binding NtrC family response regulator
MSGFTILIVDDEKAQRDALEGFLRKKGYQTHQVDSANQAVKIVEETTIDLVLSDLRMPGMDGAQLLTAIKQINPEIDVILMTAFGTIETAIQAMKDGAVDFITKPIDLAQLELVMNKVFERKQLLSENQRLRELISERLNFKGIITNSQSMHQALSVAARAASSRSTVLITGESGTGKELVAKAVHLASPRSSRAFVAVNMAALSDNLVESELFGHEKGAFTGADKFRKGRFEMAHQGTLFIDEVADVPLNTQAKLLRILQEQQFERVGSSQPIQVDVRVIAATHRSLDKMVQQRSFREDLFYRLNVIRVELPPLRERKKDIPLLAEHFIRRFAEENGKNIKGLSKEAMDVLMKHHWPGNIRELEHLLEQAVVLCRGEWINQDDISISGLMGEKPAHSLSFQDSVQALEKKLIQDALVKSQGNQSRAAELLGMSERHLRYKLQKYGMRKES